MKPVPFVLETEGTYEAPLINIFNDSTLIHVSKAVLPFPGSSRILREDEDVTTDWCDVNFGENNLSPQLLYKAAQTERYKVYGTRCRAQGARRKVSHDKRFSLCA